MAPAHCTNGACAECMTGDVRCNANHDGTETCNAGQWMPGIPCTCVDPGICMDGPDAGGAR
jgi:hypothetical protein